MPNMQDQSLDAAHSPLMNIAVRWGGTLFFAVCLWFGYELNASTHMAVSHLASLLLLMFAICILVMRRTAILRRPWGTVSDLMLCAAFAAYIVVRLVQSVHNDFYWGQAVKIVLIVLVFCAYKLLDPKGHFARLWIVDMPMLLAVCIVFGIVLAIVSGNLLTERLRVWANDYEYIAEYSCHMLPFVLFSLEQPR